MRCFRILFLVFVIFVIMIPYHDCGRGLNKKQRRSLAKEVARDMKLKLPRVLVRRFSHLTAHPRNVTFLYHTEPVEVMHIKDDIYELTSSYRQTNSTMFQVELWMEFPHIAKSAEMKATEFYIDMTPLIELQNKDRYRYCDSKVIRAKNHFSDGILELKFDVTSIYETCRVKEKLEHFKFRVRFFSSRNEKIIDLTENENMFLLFKEKDEIADITQLLPDHVERLHHNNIVRHVVPQLKFLENSRHNVEKKRTKRQCKLKHFQFSFADSGWNDYVIAPKTYYSNSCRGQCSIPIPDHLNATTYAILKAVASETDKSMKSPCCVAKDMAPLTMLVLDEDKKVMLTVQKDMIAKSCMCA